MTTAFEISHDWEDPEELHALLQFIRDQRSNANVRRIRYAYFLAEKAHRGQTRTSGEPYIVHPLAVARIMVELRMDDDSICAALLHDVLEDSSEVSAQEIEKVFGAEVLHLVEGVTKLKLANPAHLSARERAAAEITRTAETLRKMLLAVAKDFRVMVIKLADRLHNMQTLDALQPAKRTRIAMETLDIYAPLAARLGIWQVKWQLEDLAFRALHPDEFARVSEMVAKTRGQREEEIRQAILILKTAFETQSVKVLDIRGRPKHLYSIFKKMVNQKIPFESIFDLLALRIIVESVPDCYLALGIVHQAFVQIPSLFYDYIARPKPNGYQSLHTKVLGPGNQALEIQIRTQQMHEIAEHGVAAHWNYKEGTTSIDETKRLSRLREQLFDWSSDSLTSSDFLRSVSTDLFSEQVFVFTPKGDVIDLPKDSTPVDFAFRVHTKLGLTLVGAKVNGTLVPISTKLQNGDVVEIDNRSNGQPSLDWLEFAKSAHARSRIRGYFRRLNRTEDVMRGREMAEKELRSAGLDPRPYLGDEKMQRVLEHFDQCESPADVFAKIGSGLVSAQSLVGRLRGGQADTSSLETIHLSKTKEGKVTLVAGGLDQVMVSRGKCCSPIPGDEVVGYVTRGRGIVIHRRVCPNAMAYSTSEPDRLLNYAWPPDGGVYTVALKIVSINRTGLLMDVSTIFGESKTNVSTLTVKTMPNHTAEIDLTIDVKDTEHLALLMSKISNFKDIISILRLFGRLSK
jgi:GTP diphosphokinase / guanosine-3',5'-bis(diphosphate) 3'-diphosphatase